MKIDYTTIDETQFKIDERILNGEVVRLIQPQEIGCKWTQQNKVFRSSVWTTDGELVSAGLPKFVNWGEKPEVFPLPENLKGATIMEKVDGSLLIVTMWKGNLILRTRGTVDAYELDNGCELDAFKEYAKSLIDTWNKNQGDTWSISFLFEWTSPFQKIVLNYGDEPKFYLVGAVEHMDYGIWPQIALDVVAEQHNLIRPLTYTFDGGIPDLLAQVVDWKGKEGVCVYSYNNRLGPMIHKVKSADYLIRHRLKSELSSFEKLIDFWLTVGKPESFNQFQDEIEKLTDYETAQEHIGDISRIIDGYKEVKKIISGMISFIKTAVAQLPSRKDQALVIIGSYGSSGRSAMLFKLLDSKALDSGDYKKLLFQVLKK